MRTQQAEQMLAGQTWSEELVSRAAQAASEQVTPIDDVRSEAWYRREVVRVLAADGLRRAWQNALRSPAEWQETTPVVKTAKAPAAQSLKLNANEKHWIELNVNGEKLQAWVAPNDLLLNVIREQLELTGSKYGCGIGECSACTVQLDGQPVLACLVLATAAVGHDILTVEGLQLPNGELHPLQEAFLDHSAYQCGYCTPGMLLTAKSLLAEEPHPTEDDVRHYLRGNLCRCTGYASIVRAVMSCANGKEA
jgi:aerobic-type carbon monoxide dehydrogenase small subunit (CoxS/CutS family)